MTGKILAIVTLVGAVFLAGCGSAPPTAPAASSVPVATATAVPISVLADQYKALVAPSNAALKAVTAAANQPNATRTTLMPSLRAYQSTIATMNGKLPAFAAELPAADQADMQAFRQGVATELSDLTALVADTDDATFNADAQRWSNDATKSNASANLVRADLGLPPAT